MDEDPCHAQLNLIFNDRDLTDSPADAVLKFMTDYCVDEADEFFPSKYWVLVARTFSNLIVL